MKLQILGESVATGETKCWVPTAGFGNWFYFLQLRQAEAASSETLGTSLPRSNDRLQKHVKTHISLPKTTAYPSHGPSSNIVERNHKIMLKMTLRCTL